MSNHDLPHEVENSETDEHMQSRSLIPNRMALELPFQEDAMKEPSLYEPSVKEPSTPATTAFKAPPPNAGSRITSSRSSFIGRKTRSPRRSSFTLSSPPVVQTSENNAKNHPPTEDETTINNATSESEVTSLAVAKTESEQSDREGKWTGEAEAEATIARRKAIQDIMRDTSLTSTERSRKVQMLMSSCITSPQSSSVAPKTGRAMAPISPRKTRLSNTVQSMEQSAGSIQPGFTSVRGDDARVAQKTGRAMAPISPRPASLSNAELSMEHSTSSFEPGFTARGDDARVSHKTGRAMAPLSPGLPQLPQSEQFMEQSTSIIQPGVTAVRGDDARVAQKTGRAMAPISPRQTSLSKAETSTEQSTSSIQPGFTAVRGDDARVAQKTGRAMAPISPRQTRESKAEPFMEQSASNIQPGFTAVRGDDVRVAQKTGRAMAPMPPRQTSSSNAEHFMETSSSSIQPGVTAVRGDDARVAQKTGRAMAQMEQSASSIQPGFTAVRGDDVRVAHKAGRAMAPISPRQTSLSKAETSTEQSTSSIQPGFTAVRGDDARVSHKTGRATAPMSPGLSQLSQAEQPLEKCTSSTQPGFMTVRGDDSQVLDKSNRAVVMAASLPAELLSAPLIDREDINRNRARSTSPGLPNVDSFVVKPVGLPKMDDSEVSESAWELSGAAGMMKELDSASSFSLHETSGTVILMNDDSHVMREMRSHKEITSASSATFDPPGQTKMSPSLGSSSMLAEEPIETRETFDDEPDSVPVPGTAVASRRDSRISRKIANANSSVGASAASDDTAVSQKLGRTRGAAMGMTSATSAVTVGAVKTFGDDEAANKKSFVRDDLFATEEGNEINVNDYLRRQLRASQDSQRRKMDKKKTDKDFGSSRGIYKDGIVSVPKAPGAFSVKGGRGWFTGGFRQRAARGMVANRDHLAIDADVTAVGLDYVDEDETWWDRADKPTLIVGACIFIFAIICISVPVALLSTKQEPPTPAPTSPRFFQLDDFKSTLSSVSDPKSFEDPLSPQSQALNWIVYNDELQLEPNDEGIIQRFICMVMYFSNGGEKWNFPQPAVEWGSGVHECEWDFITCETNKTVGKLNLLKLGMTGKLTSEMEYLSQLTSLDLSRNDLSEVNFPTLILKMTGLRFLYLDTLKLQGNIPTEIGRLKKLEEFSLNSNSFSGIMPSEISSLSSMRNLQANVNNFEGDFFNIIEGWSELTSLDIGNNDFDGTIPTTLPQNLDFLRLDRNSISGTLPTELGKLSNLQSVIVSQNFRLGGTLPTELGLCTSLKTLHVDSNTFSGPIPTEFGKLAAIQDLRLAQNEFKGAIPSELGSCKTLIKLDLNNNNFSNSVPTELGELTALKELWLQFSDLSGSMPTEICSLRQGELDVLEADCKFTNADLRCDEVECCTRCH